MSREFSFRTRQKALQSFASEEFDLLVVGGGITGAAVARDASQRGLKVALVEQSDFASGTSSRSSKLIHGGLRYLQNFEFGLVFEALAERALLLKTAPTMVRPLRFYFPVYRGDKNGKGILSLGMWLYDLLALFRTPGFHRNLSKKKLLGEIPFLKSEGLVGGFQYFDASMWDDGLVLETLRASETHQAQVANYVEAIGPIWEGKRIGGFMVRDRETPDAQAFALHAKQVVVCAGPWTDDLGKKLSPNWQNWLAPSKGVHLVFDLKRIPIPGAMVMSSGDDDRISFVIPRPDYGDGVVIVGTTDGPTGKNTHIGSIDPEDVTYLLELLHHYFPDLKLTKDDIVSAYVGVRPLMAPQVGGQNGQPLQKVSREHHIGRGPGGTILVAGGKYTTHRKMAEEIVDEALKVWKEDASHGLCSEPPSTHAAHTQTPVNPLALTEATDAVRKKATESGSPISEKLFERYGAEAEDVLRLRGKSQIENPPGFPELEAQLRFAVEHEMVMHLEDFYFRRLPLYSSRSDHGTPYAKRLSEVLADARGLSPAEASQELARVQREIDAHSSWRT